MKLRFGLLHTYQPLFSLKMQLQKVSEFGTTMGTTDVSNRL